MTYVTDQTSVELRAHMRRLQKMPGWHNPLDDRLFAEVLALDAQVKALFDALQELRAAHAGKKPLGAALDKADAAIAKITREQPHDR